MPRLNRRAICLCLCFVLALLVLPVVMELLAERYLPGRHRYHLLPGVLGPRRDIGLLTQCSTHCREGTGQQLQDWCDEVRYNFNSADVGAYLRSACTNAVSRLETPEEQGGPNRDGCLRFCHLSFSDTDDRWSS